MKCVSENKVRRTACEVGCISKRKSITSAPTSAYWTSQIEVALRIWSYNEKVMTNFGKFEKSIMPFAVIARFFAICY